MEKVLVDFGFTPEGNGGSLQTTEGDLTLVVRDASDGWMIGVRTTEGFVLLKDRIPQLKFSLLRMFAALGINRFPGVAKRAYYAGSNPLRGD